MLPYIRSSEIIRVCDLFVEWEGVAVLENVTGRISSTRVQTFLAFPCSTLLNLFGTTDRDMEQGPTLAGLRTCVLL